MLRAAARPYAPSDAVATDAVTLLLTLLLTLPLTLLSLCALSVLVLLGHGLYI